MGRNTLFPEKKPSTTTTTYIKASFSYFIFVNLVCVFVTNPLKVKQLKSMIDSTVMTYDILSEQRLGPSALAGIATVILIFPLNGFIAKMRSKLQVQSALPVTSATVAR